jgi:hypothetical protein
VPVPTCKAVDGVTFLLILAGQRALLCAHVKRVILGAPVSAYSRGQHACRMRRAVLENSTAHLQGTQALSGFVHESMLDSLGHAQYQRQRIHAHVPAPRERACAQRSEPRFPAVIP